MAQTVTNRAKYLLATGGLDLDSDDLRMGLLKTLAGHTNVNDINFVADMESHADFAELTSGEASGYARVALTGEAVTEDETDNRAEADANDVAFGALGTGGTIVGCFIYKQVTNDSDSPVIAIYDLTSTPTNGGTVTVNIAEYLRLT
jgi:hypothetical protein